MQRNAAQVCRNALRDPTHDLARSHGLARSHALRLRWSRIVRQEADVTSLIDDSLDVSRVTSGLVALETEPVHLTHTVLDSIEQVSPLIDAKRHQFTFMAPFNTIEAMGEGTIVHGRSRW